MEHSLLKQSQLKVTSLLPYSMLLPFSMLYITLLLLLSHTLPPLPLFPLVPFLLVCHNYMYCRYVLSSHQLPSEHTVKNVISDIV